MSRFMAFIYDRFMRKTEEACLRDWRAALLAEARGRTLEVGAGTGANVAAYPEGLARLVLAEPDADLRALLAARVAGRPSLRAEVSEASLAQLPFADASFDTVVCTLVLCSVDDPARAVAELRRVLAPGGRLLFLEHVLADDPGRRRWQRVVEPLWRRVSGNCHVTRDTAALLAGGGFTVSSLTRASVRKALPWVRPSIRGTAVLS